MPNVVRTPLRYPGGKAKALRKIFEKVPIGIEAYREPFIGGGSVFIEFRQLHPKVPCWINDLNPEVYHFWKTAQANLSELTEAVRQVKVNALDGRALFRELAEVEVETLSAFDRAVRFFVLNRIRNDRGGGVFAKVFRAAVYRLLDRAFKSARSRLEKRQNYELRLQ